MSSGGDEYWRLKKIKKANEVHDNVCDLIRLLKRLGVIKRQHYKEEDHMAPMFVSWDQAAKRFVERNRYYHV
jgi:hypothetical protein